MTTLDGAGRQPAVAFEATIRGVHREPLDFFGFLTLSLGIGALHLMLDRGEL